MKSSWPSPCSAKRFAVQPQVDRERRVRRRGAVDLVDVLRLEPAATDEVEHGRGGAGVGDEDVRLEVQTLMGGDRDRSVPVEVEAGDQLAVADLATPFAEHLHQGPADGLRPAFGVPAAVLVVAGRGGRPDERGALRRGKPDVAPERPERAACLPVLHVAAHHAVPALAADLDQVRVTGGELLEARRPSGGLVDLEPAGVAVHREHLVDVGPDARRLLGEARDELGLVLEQVGVRHDFAPRAAEDVERVEPVQAQPVPDAEVPVQPVDPAARCETVERVQRRVEAVGTALEGRGVPAGQRVLLQDDRPAALAGERHRCGEASQSGSDDDGVHVLGHDRAPSDGSSSMAALRPSLGQGRRSPGRQPSPSAGPSAGPSPGPARPVAQRRGGTSTRSRSRAAWTSAKNRRASVANTVSSGCRWEK